MEEVLSKLKQHTKEINDIMLLAQSSFKIVAYLYRERSGFEIEVVNQNQFLKYSAESHWRIYVTELAKLFAARDSDWFNLNRFIRKFKKGMEYEVEQIDEHSILIWEQQLELQKAQIDNLLLQRDKLYGHTDKNREGVKNKLTFADAKELLRIVQRIVSEIYTVVFGQYPSFDPIGEPLDDLKKIIKVLVEQKQELIRFYSEHAKANGIDPLEIGLTTDPV